MAERVRGTRRPPGVEGLRVARGCLMALLLAVPAAAATGDDSVSTAVHPELRWTRDGVLLGGGIALFAGAQLLDVSVRPVPPEGLDSGEIHWSFDRDQIGKNSAQASDASDITSAAAVAYPVVVAFAIQPAGQRFGGTVRHSVVYVESFLLAAGICQVIKRAADRPRPYTYLPTDQRPEDPSYEVTEDEAFESMPSSHASSSFCGAAFAMTDHLLTRPQAGWVERVSVSFTGGLVAGMTSTLRVSAGKHFPSDVLVGGAIGVASGVTVPLTHHYLTPAGRRGPSPSGHAWLQAIGGMCAGVGAGILIANASY